MALAHSGRSHLNLNHFPFFGFIRIARMCLCVSVRVCVYFSRIFVHLTMKRNRSLCACVCYHCRRTVAELLQKKMRHNGRPQSLADAIRILFLFFRFVSFFVFLVGRAIVSRLQYFELFLTREADTCECDTLWRVKHKSV